MTPPPALLGIAIAATLGVGCSSSRPPTTRPAPSPAERARQERERANAAHARHLLESGELHAGQPLADVLARCTPYRIEFIDRYAFIEFDAVPNLAGLSLIAADGKLAVATDWSCEVTHEFFNTLGQAERHAAVTAYEARLFGR